MITTSSDAFIKNFFEMADEKDLNNAVLSGQSRNIESQTIAYIQKIIETPICNLIYFMKNHCERQAIMAADVFQFSSFENATSLLCQKLKESNNLALTQKQIGALLLDDGAKRNDGAFIKYGENHIKTAKAFGLALKYDKNKYCLSSIGLILHELPFNHREQLITRLILRNKLIVQLFITAMQKRLELEPFLYDLSHSTYIRRRTNIKKVIGILEASPEYDFAHITKNIIY